MPYSNITLTTQTGLAFITGEYVQVIHDSNNYIFGQVVSYDPNTGVLVFTPTTVVGSGSFDTWQVIASASPGTNGTSGSSGSSGSSGTSATDGTGGTSGTSGSSGSSGTNGTGGTSGTDGTGGTSGTDGTSGTSGSSGSSGTDGSAGTSGSSGTGGTSGTDGTSGSSGVSGTSGTSGTDGSGGTSGSSGTDGTSGSSGANGTSGTSGESGTSGTNGSSGTSGTTGTSGTSGIDGVSSGQVYYYNQSQTSDVSGYKVLAPIPSGAAQQTVTTSLTNNQQGVLVSSFITPQLGFSVIPAGIQHFHCHFLKQASNDQVEYYVEIQLANSAGTPIGTTLTSGNAEIGWVDASTPAEVTTDLTLPTITIDPTNRMISRIYLSNYDSAAHSIVWYTEGTSYYSFVVTSVGALPGSAGTSGSSGTSGTAGTSGVDGTSGTSGATGSSGTSGVNGTSGTSGVSGASGSSGTSGIDGTSGTSGFTGTSGTSGVDGTSGVSGTSGTSGANGTSGVNGTSGTSGVNGASGTSGVDGTSGTSGVNGTSGTSGVNGAPGTSGVNGTSGTSGVNGTSGTSVAVSGTTNTMTKFTSASTIGNSLLTDNGSTLSYNGNTVLNAGNYTSYSNFSNLYATNYFESITSRAVSNQGYAALFRNTQSAVSNFIPYSFESEYGNHSWGIVSRFRINQSGADRPSIQFSSAGGDDRWNVGYCTASDWNFRIVQNMAYRNDNSTTDNWGTERFRINTDGNTYAAIGGTLYANGSAVITSSNIGSQSVNYANSAGSASSASRAFYSIDGFTNSGAHGSSYIENYLTAANNGAGTGVVYLRMWCSEPGVTWDWAGFGFNVTNNGGSPSGFGRYNTNFGQAYMRFSTDGTLYFYNTTTGAIRTTSLSLGSTGHAQFGSTIANGSVWINNGGNYNDYNENIRLFNAPNGVSVIAFSASGVSGMPTTSILGYSDRMEFRYNNGQQFRIWNGYVTVAGSITAGGDICAYSDARVKENVKTIENALDKVIRLRGVSYNRIDSDNKKVKIGLIAQETDQVVPEVVEYSKDNDRYSVMYGNLGGLFVEAFKEQQTEINQLKELVNQLLSK